MVLSPGPGSRSTTGGTAGSAISRWGDLGREAPDLARFGASRLTAAPAYLATVRSSGVPRVHPVTPVLTDEGLFVFMEPDSPKGEDLRVRGWFALHNGVPDNAGSGGEFSVTGRGALVDDNGLWAEVATAASYEPDESYILFEFLISAVRAKAYGDTRLPSPARWSATIPEVDGGI